MTPNGAARQKHRPRLTIVAPEAPKRESDILAAVDTAQEKYRSTASRSDAQGAFRRVWFSLHGAAACRALGVYNESMTAKHVAACDVRLRAICSKCHRHFQEQKAKITGCDPTEIERVVYDIHAAASAERDEFYVAPEFEAVRSRYRAYVAEVAFASLTGDAQTRAM